MNELARLWELKRLRDLEMAELRLMSANLRKQFAEIEPLRKEANAARQRNMRQDGPTGFVMVPKP